MERRYGSATMKPPTPKAVYLIEAEPSDVCFLDEVLYWVAFQRLPYGWGDHEGDDFRSWAMPGYEVDCSTCRIADDECERVGLPQDPRNSFDWAFGVKLDDDLDTIISRAVEKAEGNDAIRCLHFPAQRDARQKRGGYRASSEMVCRSYGQVTQPFNDRRKADAILSTVGQEFRAEIVKRNYRLIPRN